MTRRLIPTPSQTVGPFFNFGLTTNTSLGRMFREGALGEPIRLILQIFDGAGAPASEDAMVEIWQADAQGRYDHPEDDASGDLAPDPNFCGFGRLSTQTDGTCVFETVKPGSIRVRQAPHINVAIFARGLLKHLYTRVYFAGDPANDEDEVMALIPADRRSTLLAHEVEAGLWRLDIRLQGDGETVFFDL